MEACVYVMKWVPALGVGGKQGSSQSSTRLQLLRWTTSGLVTLVCIRIQHFLTRDTCLLTYFAPCVTTDCSYVLTMPIEPLRSLKSRVSDPSFCSTSDIQSESSTTPSRSSIHQYTSLSLSLSLSLPYLLLSLILTLHSLHHVRPLYPHPSQFHSHPHLPPADSAAVRSSA